MVLIKSKKCSDGYNSGYLYKALNYLYDKEKALHIGGFGVDPYDLNSTYEQMNYVKNYYHKTQENPIMHFIVSFGDEVRTYEKAKAYAVLIGAFFKCRYQLLWAVHKKKRGESLFHIHFIMNSVSFVDGKLYDSSKANLGKLCEYVERVTGISCRYYFAGYCSTDDV